MLEPVPARQAPTGTMASVRSDTHQVISSSTSLQGAPEEGQDLEAYVGDGNSKKHNPDDIPKRRDRGSYGHFLTEMCCYQAA